MHTQSRLFLFEAFDLISCTTILGVFYGLAFSLYCLCAWSLYLNLQNPDKRRRAKFSLGYTSFLFFCATGLLTMNARVIQLVYINHADAPGGPFVYESTFDPAIRPCQIAGSILGFVIEVLTVAIQIWRLWVIWSATQYAVVVTILPVLLFLAYIALSVPTNLFDGVGSLGASDLLAMETATFVILSSLTALVTGLIAAHLLFARRRLKKVMGMSNIASPYLSIVTVLVESYALDSAWSLAAAISYAVSNPSYILFLEVDSTVKIVALFLIVYRVENGQGWTKQTEEKLTSLQFNHGIQSTADEASGLGSQVPTNTTIPGTISSTIDNSDSSP